VGDAKLSCPKAAYIPHPDVLMFHGYSGDPGDWSDKPSYVLQGGIPWRRLTVEVKAGLRRTDVQDSHSFDLNMDFRPIAAPNALKRSVGLLKVKNKAVASDHIWHIIMVQETQLDANRLALVAVAKNSNTVMKTWFKRHSPIIKSSGRKLDKSHG
jgi:hypothetical protein